MKKIGLFTAALALAAAAQAAPVVMPSPLVLATRVLGQVRPMNAINWKVGDFQDISIEMDSFGQLGTGKKTADKDVPEQNAVWYKQAMDMMGQSQVVETLLDRATGKVLKQIVNGQEQAVGGDQQIEILEQSETQVTVPAGTFDAMYIKAKVQTEQGEQIVELWANPIDVNLDGMLKMVLQSQFGPVSIILQKFGSAN